MVEIVVCNSDLPVTITICQAGEGSESSQLRFAGHTAKQVPHQQVLRSRLREWRHHFQVLLANH